MSINLTKAPLSLEDAKQLWREDGATRLDDAIRHLNNASAALDRLADKLDRKGPLAAKLRDLSALWDEHYAELSNLSTAAEELVRSTTPGEVQAPLTPGVGREDTV